MNQQEYPHYFCLQTGGVSNPSRMDQGINWSGWLMSMALFCARTTRIQHHQTPNRRQRNQRFLNQPEPSAIVCEARQNRHWRESIHHPRQSHVF